MKAAATLVIALKLVVSAAFLGSLCCRAAAVQSDQISLAGQWRFQLDRANTGLWDEFAPNLQTVRAQLHGGVGGQLIESEREVTFGLRQIATDGTQFTINGRKTFFRGTLECCIFPLTGHPPTEVRSLMIPLL